MDSQPLAREEIDLGPRELGTDRIDDAEPVGQLATRAANQSGDARHIASLDDVAGRLTLRRRRREHAPGCCEYDRGNPELAFCALGQNS